MVRRSWCAVAWTGCSLKMVEQSGVQASSLDERDGKTWNVTVRAGTVVVAAGALPLSGDSCAVRDLRIRILDAICTCILPPLA